MSEFDELLEDAEAGNVTAMHLLAWAYHEGEGTPKDLTLYFTWLKKAVEAEVAAGEVDDNAMRILAWAYRYGEGTPKDIAQYFAWMKKAAEAGNVDAMYSLVVAYRDGEGTPKDLTQHFAWMKKAAEAGHVNAMFGLAGAYFFGEGTEPDVDLYFEWMGKAAKAGDTDAAMLHYVNSILSEQQIKDIETLNFFMGLFFSVEEIKKRHAMGDGNQTIAHFTNFEALEKMLPLKNSEPLPPANNHLRLYNIEYLNDPYEGCRLFQHMKESRRYKKMYNSLFDEMDKKSPIALLHEDLSVYVCSFTTLADRLDLWRAYGRDGKGVSIVSPLAAFEDDVYFHTLGGHFKESRESPATLEMKKPAAGTPATDPTPQPTKTAPRVLYRVKYSDDDIKETLKELHPHLKEIASLLPKATDEVKNALRKCVIALLGDILFLYKNPEYENEKEARLVFAATIDNPMLEPDERTPGRLFVKTDNFLFAGKDSSIIIGPKVEDKKVLELNLKFRLVKHGFKDAQVKQSEVAYR